MTFESLELFVGQIIDFDCLLNNLAALRYRKTKKAIQEGDYSYRGEIIDIYPINFDSPIRIDFNNDKIQRIASVNIATGKSIWQHKITIILPNKITNKKQVFSSDIPLNNFVDIREGDYVVHHNHGIGKFLGITELSVNNELKPHFVIEYSQGDKLFVPKHDIRLVQKYLSFNKKPPRLYKLGSKEWKRVRSHIQKNLQNF